MVRNVPVECNLNLFQTYPLKCMATNQTNPNRAGVAEPRLKIWDKLLDKQTDRQTDRVVYRVALQQKRVVTVPVILCNLAR